MEAFIPLGILIGASVIIYIYLQYALEKKRTGALQSFCQRYDYRFTPRPEDDFGDFSIFHEARSTHMKNLIEATISKVAMKVFDYRYAPGGKGQKVHQQTAAIASYENLDLPAFVLKPADLGSKSIAFGGRREIGFDGFPEFSRRYRVSCDDEGAIRRTLNGSVLKYFEGIPASLTLEGRGGTMLMYFESRLATPEEMQSFMEGVCRTVKTLSFS